MKANFISLNVSKCNAERIHIWQKKIWFLQNIPLLILAETLIANTKSSHLKTKRNPSVISLRNSTQKIINSPMLFWLCLCFLFRFFTVTWHLVAGVTYAVHTDDSLLTGDLSSVAVQWWRYDGCTANYRDRRFRTCVTNIKSLQILWIIKGKRHRHT